MAEEESSYLITDFSKAAVDVTHFCCCFLELFNVDCIQNNKAELKQVLVNRKVVKSIANGVKI